MCFNDSVFNNDDVNAILRPGNSSKANDMSKTGKFGLGFNSVYHITDMPSAPKRGDGSSGAMAVNEQSTFW